MRQAIERTGAEVISYDGPTMLVALPTPASDALAAIAAAGYRVADDLYYFPLGSDKPAERLRHALAKYGAARSFWLYARVSPRGAA
jgi:hypothetical protein